MQPINAPATPMKPTLIYLRNRYHFDITALAQQALVHPEIVYRMLLHQAVSSRMAAQVLTALSLRTGQSYSLNNVKVKLSERE